MSAEISASQADGHAGPVEVEEAPPPPPPEGDARIAVLEALLFSAAAPLHVDQLALLLSITADEVAAALTLLHEKYARPDSGLSLREVSGGYQLATRTDCSEWVFRLHGHRRRSPITPALLETLAIIAYKQPVTRAQIEAVRGVDCGGVVRALQDAGLVEIVGRKELPGRPALYGSTEVFLKTFGLKSLGDLPAPPGMVASLPAPEMPAAE